MRITPQPGRRRGSRTRLQVRAPEAIPLRTQSVRASRDRLTSTRNSCSQSTAQERQVPAAMQGPPLVPSAPPKGMMMIATQTRTPKRHAEEKGAKLTCFVPFSRCREVRRVWRTIRVTHNPQRKPLCELWRCGLGGRPRLGSQSGNVKFLNLESREDERPHGLASTETQNHETHAQRLAINA